MRKIILSEFISVDGVMEGPGSKDSFEFAGWTMPYANKEILKFKHDELFAADALLIGRKTYEGFADAWPKANDTGDFGERMNDIRKYVVSASLNNLDWKNSYPIKTDVERQIRKLREGEGKDILVFGSGELADALMDWGLIDEFRLVVYPIILGTGQRLFKKTLKTALQLKEEKKLPNGVLILTYAANRT